MVPKKGLEPPHPCGYMDLNHARLPIPPLRQVTALRGDRGRLEGRYRDLYSYKAETECQTVARFAVLARHIQAETFDDKVNAMAGKRSLQPKAKLQGKAKVQEDV